ncbi:MAG: ribonuclease H-like domain-containing protein [Proteobacteria bacterium]|nr:ribonuclease H-like domain-containing protein [Pseudomonadota bacterium]
MMADTAPTPWLADVVTDTETNGLLSTVDTLHCAVIFDRRTGQEHRYPPTETKRYQEDLQRYVDLGLRVAAHNGIKYDHPVLRKLLPKLHIPQEALIDTLTCARLVWPDIKKSDTNLVKSRRLPGSLWGSHSLKAWGYRLGILKGDYGEQEDAWDKYTPEMLDYCAQDVRVTLALLERIEAKLPALQSLELEHRVSWLLAQQERNGFHFDSGAARSLYLKLVERRAALENKLAGWFPPWTVELRPFTPKVNNKKLGYVKGVPVVKKKTLVFNPGSRDHIANRLKTLFGWDPTEFTPSGKPQVDEEILKHLPYPPVADLVEYLLVQKRIGQVGDGDNAWLKLVSPEGKIHGSITPNGAVTGRCTHSYPNVSQTPSSDSPYGEDCRACWVVPPGWWLVGADASGLELRCLAHFMHPYDDGAYTRILLTGDSSKGTDIHSVNQRAAGLPTRANAKTFIYAFLYGAGDGKLGQIIGKDRAAGRRLRTKFLAGLPALSMLIDKVKAASKRGYIIGLDRRIVPIRSEHAALNTLLQSAGAVICKQWLINFHTVMEERGFIHGFDGDYAQVAFVHDEVQIACRTEAIAREVAELAPLMVRKAGEQFNFRCPTDGESKIGHTWAETH